MANLHSQRCMKMLILYMDKSCCSAVKLLFFVLIFFFSGHVFAQKNQLPNTVKIAALLDSATKYSETDPLKSAPLSVEAYALAVNENDTLSMSEALRLYSISSQFINSQDTTTKVILESIRLAGSRFPCQRAKCIMNYADYLRKGDGSEKALKLLIPNARRLFYCGLTKDFMYSIYLIGLVYDKLGEDIKAIYTYNLLKDIANKKNDSFFQFKAYNSLLIVFLQLNKNPESLFREMMIAADRTGSPETQAVGWNNIAKYYSRVGDYEKADYCYDKAIEKSLETGNDENIAHISLTVCMHYIRRNNFNKAIPVFHEAEKRDHFIVQNNWIGIYEGIKARILLYLGNSEEAEKSINISIINLKNEKNYEVLIDIYKIATLIFEARKKYDLAYYYQSLVLEYTTLFMARSDNKVENNLYYKVLLDLEVSKAKTIELKNENLVKQRRIYYLLISVFIIILILIVLFLYFMSNRYKRRILNSEQQKETLLAARIRLTNELNAKNKEIASFVLNQAMVNETTGEVITQMRQLGSKSTRETQKKLYELASLLSTSQNKNIWKEFDHYFSLVNPDFFSKLTQTHSGLTSRDLRYCALISLQLSSKEMSLITGMTLQSIHVLRSRLRQKLAIDHDEDLGVYLAQFSETAG
ncbi:hypothetical protein SDC9_63587 [bioreactor metagenome]|uniref:HTH luxR-type domain-containing protein n=1 Tax=bioreactor metagenome TaxID=1076179 RepID=A0A644XM67_9ZZZZ